MRALLAQLEPAPGDLDANAATVAAALAEHPEADLAVFPELFLTGYDPGRAAELALAPDEAPLRALAAVARRHGTALLLGFAERLPSGGVANAVACIGADGGWVASYRKTHLFGDVERAAFAAGGELRLAGLAGARVGPLICFDMEFPEPARALARAGAEVLVTAAANMEPYGAEHLLHARARALENRRPHLYVNRVGAESGLRFVGGSAAVAPDGGVLAHLGQGSELALVQVPVRHAAAHDVDYLEHVRVDLPVEVAASPAIQGGPDEQ